jgi:hypothetical protein
MSNRRVCVFCGEGPVDKNKEHVLPQWLLEMTGDPSRVVKFGTDFSTGRTIEFAWSSLVVPACSSCNGDFSKLENTAKPIVEKLVLRQAVPAADYLILLDWLDKVRIGLWIEYSLLQKIPEAVQPNFYVQSRVGTKDRLVALYPLTGNPQGLNAVGVESFVFHRTPSCFGLRINNLLILNMSADYLFSGRCGFPFPKTRELMLDGEHTGKIILSDFETARRVRHPIMKKRLHKPSVLLFQPIMQARNEIRPITQADFPPPKESGFLREFSSFDSFLAEHTIPPYPSGKGILFRQYSDSVEAVGDMSQTMEFDSVIGRECKSTYELFAQVYEFQNFVQNLFKAAAESGELKRNYLNAVKMATRENSKVSRKLRQLSNQSPPDGPRSISNRAATKK